MNDMKKDTYTLWIDDELVATRDHNRDGYNDLLAEASEVQGKAACEIYSSKDDQAVWTSDSETIIEEQAAQASECGGILFARTTNPTATTELTRRCKMEIIVYITTASVALAFYADL